MAVGALFAILRLLTGRATTVSSRDILFLLGLGLHLAIILGLITSTSEVDAVFKYMLKIVHRLNGGTALRQ